MSAFWSIPPNIVPDPADVRSPKGDSYRRALATEAARLREDGERPTQEQIDELDAAGIPHSFDEPSEAELERYYNGGGAVMEPDLDGYELGDPKRLGPGGRW